MASASPSEVVCMLSSGFVISEVIQTVPSLYMVHMDGWLLSVMDIYYVYAVTLEALSWLDEGHVQDECMFRIGEH